ncbi:uncharacterized protein [Diadema setosum]|uniref:uncharacterized protein n=1 Tax=Diadema setosum TaxID=31175 RepID=UPI003B3A796E
MPKVTYSEASLKDAINRVRLGELSQRQASIQFSIPRSTLHDKLSGRRPEGVNKPGPSPRRTKPKAKEARVAKKWAVQLSAKKYVCNKEPSRKENDCSKRQTVKTVPNITYSEASLENAMKKVRQGEMSQRQASIQFSIPRSTLYDKLSGRRPEGVNKRGPLPFLTKAEEARIAKWAVQMSRIGYCRNKQQILKMVQDIIRSEGRKTPFKDHKPGNNWYKRFMARNPMLSMIMTKGCGVRRAVSTSNTLHDWYQGLYVYLKSENSASILDCADRIWNVGESSFQISPRSDRASNSKASESVDAFTKGTKTMLTMLEAASASGKYVPPFIVYPGQRMSRKWKLPEEAPDSWFYGVSKTGSINSELFFSWMCNHFHPFLRSVGTNFPVLLLIDGHSTHVDHHVSEFCAENGIILYGLLTHSSHVRHPLDTVFDPLRKLYNKAKAAWKDKHLGKCPNRAVFASIFAKAWAEMKPEYARAGFRDAGIFPFTGERDPDDTAASQLFKATPAVSTSSTASAAVLSSTPPRTPSPASSSDLSSSDSESTESSSDSSPSSSHASPNPRRQPVGAPRLDDHVGPHLNKHQVHPKGTRVQKIRKAVPQAILGVGKRAYQERKREEEDAREKRRKRRMKERRASKAEEKKKSEEKASGKRKAKRARTDVIPEGQCGEDNGDFGEADAEWEGDSHSRPWIDVVGFSELAGMTVKEIQEAVMTHQSSVVTMSSPSSAAKSYNVLNPIQSALELAVDLQKYILRLKAMFMSEDGLEVDYTRLKYSDLFTNFQGKTRELQAINLRPLTSDQRKAFFINVYNALTVHALAVREKLPSSVLEIENFWQTSAYIIAGHAYSLDDIEHGILRKNRPHPSTKKCCFQDDDPRLTFAVDDLDARIHFALNCGAQSCPPINVYTEKNLEKALDMASRNYLDQEVEVDTDAMEIKLPALLKWYGSDAAETQLEVVRWTVPYLSQEKAQQVRDLLGTNVATGNMTITFKPYRWAINSVDASRANRSGAT